MHVFGGAKDSPVIAAREREGRIFDQIRVESQVAGHPDRNFDGIVRDDSGDCESIYTCASQALFQIGPDESIKSGRWHLSRCAISGHEHLSPDGMVDVSFANAGAISAAPVREAKQ
jgi:hypothetical protein